MKAHVVEMMGLPKSLVEESKSIYITLDGSLSTRRSSRTSTPSLVVAKSFRTKSDVGAKRKESYNTPVKEQGAS